MQYVFGISAVALFVPVLYHRIANEESDSLNKDAPGACMPGSLTVSQADCKKVPCCEHACFTVIVRTATI